MTNEVSGVVCVHCGEIINILQWVKWSPIYCLYVIWHGCHVPQALLSFLELIFSDYFHQCYQISMYVSFTTSEANG